MAEFIVTDPSGKEHVVSAPDGATQEQALAYAKEQFGSTAGGAATGNPNLRRQGDTALKPDLKSPIQALGEVAASGAVGGVMGAFAPEVAQGVGRAVSAIPHPAARAVGGFVESSVPALRAAGRTQTGIAGAASGLASETAGKMAEGAGAGPVTAEAARVVGGGVGPAPLNFGIDVLKKYVVTPSFTVLSKAKKEAVKMLLGKFDSAPDSLSAQERAYVDQLVNEIRGGTITTAPMDKLGSLMGAEGKRLLSASEQQMIGALRQAGGVGGVGGFPAANTELADIGEGIRKVALPRFEALDKAQKDAFDATKQIRDNIVSQSEQAGKYISDTPEYGNIVQRLNTELQNTEAMKRSPSVQRTYRRILSDLTNPEQLPGEQKLVQNGLELNLETLPGKPKPVTFQALDDVRRKLGEAFRGKPPEGYEGIEAAAAKELYMKVRDAQIAYAGGKGGPQEKLLADYAADIPGLQAYTSKIGKKVTGLDQYREGVYATDPSDIPKAFFRTRASVKALEDLMGNKTKVQAAALSFADKELAGKDAGQARRWFGENSEWLAETPATRTLVDKYIARLEGSERSLRNAERFAEQAAVNSNMLIGKGVPAQRAIDLIKSGDADFWNVVAPVVAKSPQAKKDMLDAVRQVVADMPNTEATTRFFSINVRPFLERAKIASPNDLDFISSRLKAVTELKLPEPEKLGIMRRMVLQAAAGEVSSVAGRGMVNAMMAIVPR